MPTSRRPGWDYVHRAFCRSEYAEFRMAVLAQRYLI